ncbi:hypothetical protein EDB81DRAFT_701995 [Dactylonectria macrodidyma]|uniref:Uncharacterized protein n=1 Tax=Dactylonectria macrodidyma TaxID=307937 RepID=A0A9P9ICE0_9HYPO|nr:hypothetical protein EDB81DRAFT_701995 [Dactylonectria macrodidyma]
MHKAQNSVSSIMAASPDRNNNERPLEFVTFSIPPQDADPTKHADSLRVIRSHAMRDHVWTQNHPSIARKGLGETNRTLRQQSAHMGRYRLNEKPNPVSKRPRRSNKGTTSSGDCTIPPQARYSNAILSELDLGSVLQHQVLHGSEVSLGTRFNPFNATLLNLGSKSQRLIFYYHQAYSMNIVALNFQEHCLSNAIANSALLHAILYIVATDYDLKRGESDSALSIHHGGEAVRAINMQLNNGVLADTTVAAVAILATRENLNGRFQLANIHMNGLQHMIAKKGGIENIKDIHQRVATWADFCDSNVRNCRPRFCQPPISPLMPLNNASINLMGAMLNPEDILGAASPIIPVIQTLRHISLSMDSSHSGILDRSLISLSIYEAEYSLNLLNRPMGGVSEYGNGQPSEVVPLKIAAHIYLYLMIRELPGGSPVFGELTRRFRASLEAQTEQWWIASRDRQCWVLWMLYIAFAAAPEEPNKQWFLTKGLLLCEMLNLMARDELERILRSVLWNGSRCHDELNKDSGFGELVNMVRLRSVSDNSSDAVNAAALSTWNCAN